MLLPLIAASLNDPAGNNYHCGVCQMGTFHFYHSFYLYYRMGFPVSFIHSIIYIVMDAQCSTHIIASNPLLLLLCCSNYPKFGHGRGLPSVFFGHVCLSTTHTCFFFSVTAVCPKLCCTFSGQSLQSVYSP